MAASLPRDYDLFAPERRNGDGSFLAVLIVQVIHLDFQRRTYYETTCLGFHREPIWGRRGDILGRLGATSGPPWGVLGAS